MENKVNQINIYSLAYTKDTDKSYLKQHGQFFTLNQSLLDKLMESKLNPKSILEPSFGTGRIIVEAKRYYPNAYIDAVELDTKLFNKTKEIIQCSDVKFINVDYLTYNTNKKYDLIIGNPPYFETKVTKEEFPEIINGRVNIYSLFIYKSINLLAENGQIRFIIPSSILTSKYFTKIREYIVKHTEVVDIIKFKDDNLFDKVKQNVIILVLQKKKNTGKNIQVINNRLIFGNIKLNLTNSTTISKLGCKVKTGNIEWNKYKEELKFTNLEKRPLIKSGNLHDKAITNITNYIRLTKENEKKLTITPCILVNRITSNLNPKLNIYYKKDCNPVFIENHINVITGDKDKLDIIYKSLKNEKTIEFIKEFISNTQISQDELENIIPIQI
jgi:adenine-specific DNA-methyltransferase